MYVKNISFTKILMDSVLVKRIQSQQKHFGHQSYTPNELHLNRVSLKLNNIVSACDLI